MEQGRGSSVGQYEPSSIYVGPLESKYLSPSDLLIPSIWGICIHLIYIALLIPMAVLFDDNEKNLRQCMDEQFVVLLYALLSVHGLIVLIDALSAYHALTAKASGTNQCLNGLTAIRFTLITAELLLVLYGCYVVWMDDNNSSCWDSNVSEDDTLYILLVLFLALNLSVIMWTWCCIFCCFSSRNGSKEEDPDSEHRFIRRLCHCLLRDEEVGQIATRYYGMGGLLHILSQGTRYTPSEVMTGLQLLRMLQTHYGKMSSVEMAESNPSYYRKMSPSKSKQDADVLSECEYFTLYANAAYGIALYSMSRPCAICCAPPCCLPAHLEDEGVVLRQTKCCHPVQIDNSSMKVFLQSTGCVDPPSDLLSSNFKLQTSTFKLQTSNFKLQTSHHPIVKHPSTHNI